VRDDRGGKCERSEPFGDGVRGYDVPPVVPVGEHACGQRKEKRRKKQREPNEAEIERAMPE